MNKEDVKYDDGLDVEEGSGMFGTPTYETRGFIDVVDGIVTSVHTEGIIINFTVRYTDTTGFEKKITSEEI